LAVEAATALGEVGYGLGGMDDDDLANVDRALRPLRAAAGDFSSEAPAT
jgi:hypothetical protein